MRISYQDLTDLIARILSRAGMPDDVARAVADEIAFAEARGKASHGLAMIETMLKRAKSEGEIEIVEHRPNAHLIRGGGLAGPYVAKLAVDQLRLSTEEHGMAMVGVLNPSTFLTAGYGVWRAAKENRLVACAITVAKARIAPHGGRRPVLGTNPIALAFPAQPYPFLVDMAMSKIPGKELDRAIERRDRLPEGVALDPTGNPTTDPQAARNGALTPFGGYKGSALAIVVELLAGALLGGKCGLDKRNPRAMLFAACRLDLFRDAADAESAATRLREDIRGSLGSDVEAAVRAPGDQSEMRFQEALLSGLELAEDEHARLRRLLE